MRFGIAIKPLKISEIPHTIDSDEREPSNTHIKNMIL